MKGTWSLTRCAAPTSTRGGTLRCIHVAKRCSEHGPIWRNPGVVLAVAVVWRIRPWWPNAFGRAQDRGEAHTCPLVTPCRACAAGVPGGEQ